MIILAFAWMIALPLWALLFDFKFLFLLLLLLLTYHFLQSFVFKRSHKSLFQRFRPEVQGKVGYPTILARMEIDCDRIDRFIDEYNEKNPDNRLSYSQVAIKSLGEMMKNSRTMSKTVRFCNVTEIQPGLILLVDVQGKQLGQICIRDIDKMNITEIK